MDFGYLFWIALIGGPTLLVLSIVVGLVRAVNKSKKSGVQIENIRAQLILPSTDYKAMEEFLLVKEPYLTAELIILLINRINELKVEDQIKEDFDSKLRISTTKDTEELPSLGDALLEKWKKK